MSSKGSIMVIMGALRYPYDLLEREQHCRKCLYTATTPVMMYMIIIM